MSLGLSVLRRDLSSSSLVDAMPGHSDLDVPSSFLEAPARLTLPSVDESSQADREEPPAGSERYQIGALLGRGGMASVYLGFDRQLERRVALKLLDRPLHAAAEPFLREARAQARVRHDNVLEVYETGELAGRPYIAMRYVDGPTLRELAGLPLEAKLRLLGEVAEGLHAAHRAGLLHRDVKPSNVLVEALADGKYKPYVADFGIATVLDSTMPGAAAFAGTPAFMAPERGRREGVVDRRSDVYSLGVSACELLTGSLPGVGRPLAGLLEPLPADVVAIVRRCLADNPAERYPSARAVAEELQRYLDGDVVEAHAATLAYRLTKFATRHRRLLAVAGVAGLLLAIALATAAVLGLTAMRANARAETRRGQAETLIAFMLGDLRAKLEPSSSLAVLDDVGEKALEYFAAVPREELSMGELSSRARALSQIGDVRIGQGNLEGAKRPLAESLALAEELVRRDPAALGPLFELGQADFWVGYVAWKQGRLEAANERFEAYLDVARRLVARVPESPDYLLELHYATSNLGSVRESRGDVAAAIDAFGEALSTIERLVARDPSRGDWQFELAAAHNSLAVPLQATGHYAEAVKHYRSDLELRERMLVADPQNRRGREFLGTSQAYMASGLLPLGRAGEAKEQAGQAVRGLETLLAEDTEHAVRRFKLANALLQLGRANLALGERQAADQAFRRQSEILASLVELDPTNDDWQRQLAIAHYHRALASSRSSTALAEVERALAILDGTTAGTDGAHRRRWAAAAWLLLGDLRATAGDIEPARRAFQRALEQVGSDAAAAQDLELAATWLRIQVRVGRSAETRGVAGTLLANGYRESGFPDPIAIERELADLAGATDPSAEPHH